MLECLVVLSYYMFHPVLTLTAYCLQLGDAGKSSTIASFKDPNIATSLLVIDLINSLRPGKVKYGIVTDGVRDEVRLSLVVMCLEIYYA